MTGPIKPTIIYLGGGRYHAHYISPSIAGKYKLDLRLGSIALKGSPFNVNVAGAVVDASRWRTSGIENNAVAGTVSSFSIVARDTKDKVVTDCQGVTFSVFSSSGNVQLTQLSHIFLPEHSSL